MESTIIQMNLQKHGSFIENMKKRELMDICWQSVMNLSQRQCKNLSVEDISTKLDCDSETAITIINILHEKNILSIELHIYCDECSAENVVLCDGFNDSIVRCHNCGKQICASKDTCDSIKRYTIDKTALEEFIRRDYYDIYSNSKNTAKIIDFEPKIQAVELEEKASINENGEKSNAIVDEKAEIDLINKRHRQEDIIKSLIVIFFLASVIVGLIAFAIVEICSLFLCKHNHVLIYDIIMNAIKGSLLEEYLPDSFFAIIGILVTACGTLVLFAVKTIIVWVDKLKKLIVW